MAIARTRGSPQNYWPGFVDAMAAILMVVIFLVMVFALAQFSFAQLLSRSEIEVSDLEQRLSAMSGEIEAARREIASGQARVAETESLLDRTRVALDEASAQAEVQRGRADGLALQLTEAEDRVARSVEELTTSEARILELVAGIAALEETVESNEQSLVAAGSEKSELEKQLARLNEELAAIVAALAAIETQAGAQALEIEELNLRLTQALASEVERLESYRSEFFGRLRDLLGDRAGILIVGDRFILQSEILFPSGEAHLTPRGRLELMRLAATLRDLSADIPSDIDWVLRVDGHTDARPISTNEFPSNWELSTARALDVVQFFVAEGIAPERLVAAGFGQFRPLDAGDTPDAYARNRRIEFKLTER